MAYKLVFVHRKARSYLFPVPTRRTVQIYNLFYHTIEGFFCFKTSTFPGIIWRKLLLAWTWHELGTILDFPNHGKLNLVSDLVVQQTACECVNAQHKTDPEVSGTTVSNNVKLQFWNQISTYPLSFCTTLLCRKGIYSPCLLRILMNIERYHAVKCQ